MNIIKMLILVALITVASPASARIYFCSSADYVRNLVTNDWKEAIGGRGIVGKSTAILYVREKVGTFSFVIFSPDNMSCIILVGTDWEFIYQGASHEDDEDTLDYSN